MAQTFRERVNAPDEHDDAREIWMLIRSWLTIFRVLLVIATIIIAEIFEEISMLNFSLSVWAIVIGFPLFLLVSMVIIQGDKRFAPDLEEKRRKHMEDNLLINADRFESATGLHIRHYSQSIPHEYHALQSLHLPLK